MGGTVADHLRQWVAAARGALEWHLETGDAALPVPEGFRVPPLGRIADSAPGDGAPGDRAPGARASRGGATPGDRRDAPRAAPAGFAKLAEAAGAATPAAARRRAKGPPPQAAPRSAPQPDPSSAPSAPPAAPRPTAPSGSPAAASAAPVEPAASPPPSALPSVEGDTPTAAAALRVLRDEIGACTRCPLHQGRTELVFGAGHPQARVMFVADQPGRADDQVGLPFVDDAGQLLGRMVRAMGLDRSQVYLTHLVKCHDPEQGPDPGLEACGGFLERQIAIVRPEVIIALGGVAARQLSGVAQQLPHLRGQWHAHGGVPVLATFHPNALAQHPQSKRQVWTDLKSAMRKLGLSLPGRRGR